MITPTKRTSSSPGTRSAPWAAHHNHAPTRPDQMKGPNPPARQGKTRATPGQPAGPRPYPETGNINQHRNPGRVYRRPQDRERSRPGVFVRATGTSVSWEETRGHAEV